MQYVYVIKSFDTQSWVEKSNVIAFKTREEAWKFCMEQSESDSVIYDWDKVHIGKMTPPYPKKPKQITIAP